MDTYAPPLEAVVEIEATPAVVWALVSDVTRMADWSPQVTSTRLRSGFDEVALGAEFTNRNRHGEMEWTTHAEIVRFEPERALAFRIAENWQVWSFDLEPTATGSRLTQRRDSPEGVSPLSRELTDGFFGGSGPFTEVMRAGMTETLERIKESAERA